ncbi:MAG: family 43 glycosylhydrolase [Clostridia bacterium]|nr:family 43 glycosylhydrolase [Clostridia bacterium]
MRIICILATLVMLLPASKALAETYDSLTPGELWADNNEGHIQAHGGCVIWDESTQKYYWYGEARKTSVIPSNLQWLANAGERIGVSCYSSNDLYNWTYEGLALQMLHYYTGSYPESDIQPYRVIERPKVIYNEMTKKYVMWMHIDTSDYSYARAGVAISDTPTGPFSYLGSVRPNDQMARDMTVFVDDDNTAYLYASGDYNSTMYCHKLTDDYLSIEGTYTKMFENWFREAPAVFKYNNLYYMINSGCTGWSPNKADYAVASNPMGPWSSKGNPCVGTDAATTFNGQGCYVLPLNRDNGKFIFMADIWRPDNHSDSRYIWLPIDIASDGSIRIEWRDSWRISDYAEPYNVPPIPDLLLAKGSVYRKKIVTDGLKDFRIISQDTNAVKIKCSEDVLTIYALDNGASEIRLRLGGGGYSGVSLDFTVTVSDNAARAYEQQDEYVLIQAADALKETEYAYSAARDYHRWETFESGVKVMPDSGGEWRDENRLWTAPSLNFRVYFSRGGDYYFLANCSHPDISGNSIHVGLNDTYLFTLSSENHVGENLWLSSKEWLINVPEPGVYTVNIWAREDGAVVNQLCFSSEFLTNATSLQLSPLTNAAMQSAELSEEEKIAFDIELNPVPAVLYEDIEMTAFFGTSVVWQNGGDAVLPDGSVHRRARGSGDAYLTLTGIYKNGETYVHREYLVIVPAERGELKASADFSTIDIGTITDRAFVTFDLHAYKISDGIVALCSPSAVPSNWSDYPVTFRICPDATFDARNGANYEATERVTYRELYTYHVCLDLNVRDNVYCAYVTTPDAATYTIAQNFSFRIPAAALGRLSVRGGDGVEAGLFEIENLYVSRGGADIIHAYADKTRLNAEIVCFHDETMKAYAAFYGADGKTLESSAVFTISEGLNTLKTNAPAEYTFACVFVFDNTLEPCAEKWTANKRPASFSITQADLISSHQDNDALHTIPISRTVTAYHFSFVDRGSQDSGIILGNSTQLNSSSSNYFSNGSIVLLFSEGRLYTRDRYQKKEAAEYSVGEKTRVCILADLTNQLYTVYVNGSLAAEDISFRTEVDSIDTLALVENSDGEMFDIYDFDIR